MLLLRFGLIFFSFSPQVFLVPHRRCKHPQAKLFGWILSWKWALISWLAASKDRCKPQKLCLSFDCLVYFVLLWQQTRKILSYRRVTPLNESTPASRWVRVSEGRTEPGGMSLAPQQTAAGMGQVPAWRRELPRRTAFSAFKLNAEKF